MKKVTIVGMGLGTHTVTPEAWEAIAGADVLLGAPRQLAFCEELSKPSHPYYLPQDVGALIASDNAQAFAVLVSGDVGFYSAAAGLADALATYDLRFIPGISTVNAFFAGLKLPWQDAAFVSAHGRDMHVADTVRRNRLTLCLAGDNVHEIGAALCKAGFGKLGVHIGENLGTEQERIYEACADDLLQGAYPSLTVLLFLNEAFDDRTPCGLPDSSFSRFAGIPMTKSEVRAVAMSKLNLRPTDCCWDIGAGSGSVTVEMALSAHHKHVYAVERREEAIPLITQNCAAFHLGNVTAVCGAAPEALEPLPTPDAVFIGGSGGEMGGIISAVLRKNPEARIVVSGVTIESVASVLSVLASAGLEPEIMQVNIARGKRAGELHLMEAQNPVTILSVGGKP